MEEKASTEKVPAPDDDFVEYDPSGRYGRYDEVLGKGTFKTVYRAFDEFEGLEVAWNKVKMLDVVRNMEDTEDINSEVHLLKTLKHKNIIKYYNSWFDNEKNIINIITEVFTSGTLRQYRMKHKRVEPRALKNWARQILEGLLYLHSLDPPVIHRDLKCDNVFVNGNHGEVKIGDLGLAAILCKTGSAHSVLGTPEFMAPEFYNEDYNELVDVYAFGMCLLEMETLEYPYVECTNAVQIYKKVIEGVKPLSLEKVKDSQMKEFIERCIAKVSERCSARDLLKDPFMKIDMADEVEGHSTHSCSSGDNSVHSEANIISPGSGSSLQIADYVFTVESSRKDVKTISLKLSIPDQTGHVRNIHFPFDITTDTAMSVATEMVTELDLSVQDITSIAAMIESEVKAHNKAEDVSENDIGGTSTVGTAMFSDQHESPSMSNDGLNNEDSDNFILERLPSGRVYHSASKRASLGSPMRRFVSRFYSDESAISHVSLNNLVLCPTEQMKKVIASVEPAEYKRSGSDSKSLLEYGVEDLKLLPNKLEHMLKEQYRELDELKCKHKQQIEDILQEVPANHRLEMIKLCLLKVSISSDSPVKDRAAMLRRYMHKLGAALYMGKASRRKKQLEDASMSIDFSSVQKNLYVKIILAGGLVELYHCAITASRIMEKYPGMTVARPDIFKHPNESLVRPDEVLLPGEKFYLVPTSTVRKLRRKYQFREERESTEAKALERRRLEWSRPIEGGAKEGKEETEEQVCYAREFYVSKEKWSDFALKKCCKDGESGEKKGFTPPIKKAKSWRKLGWQPSLDSVEEVSP